MSLATRCTSCGTVFRIVQDQLKVSEGWVRCGRCDAVFDAAPGLFDLALDAPPAWARAAPPQPAEPPAAPVVASTASTPAHPADAMGPEWGRRAATTGELPASIPPTAIDNPAAAPHRATAPTASRSPNPNVVAPAEPTFAMPAGSMAPTADRPPPEFVRRGRRDAFWRRRAGVAVFWGGALLLLLALAAQVAQHYSDIAASRWPPLRPALVRWCSATGCSVAAPRRIEELVVDSSALAPVAGTSALRLGIALRNRAAYPVAVPSVDLSLSDTAGRLIARRALLPSDFQAPTPALAAGAELALQALITTGNAAVAGYTVEIFYP